MAKALEEILWNHCVIGLCEVSPQGQILNANPSLCALLEYSPVELQNRTIQELTHPEDLEDDLEMVRRVAKGDLDSYLMAKRYITKSNRIIWAKLRVDAVRDDDGKLHAFLSQVAPATYVTDALDSGDYVRKLKSPAELVKKHPHWLVAFISGLAILGHGIFTGNSSISNFGQILILTAIGGYNFQRDVSNGKK